MSFLSSHFSTHTPPKLFPLQSTKASGGIAPVVLQIFFTPGHPAEGMVNVHSQQVLFLPQARDNAKRSINRYFIVYYFLRISNTTRYPVLKAGLI